MQDSQVLRSDLESLQHWERTWDMEFNPGKCQVIHITRSKSPVKSRYFIHNQELESVDAAKYLGVTISKDLSWNTHINNITSTANKTLGFVKRNVVTKNKDIKTMAYNSLVCPQVEYASVVWSPYTKDNINKIEKVQRRAARWVLNDYSSYSSVTDMLSNLGWRSLENRRTDTCFAMFYKIVYGLVATRELPYHFRQILSILKYTLAICTLFLTDRFIHQSVIINTHFSPYPLFFGTSYQLISSWFLILTPLKQKSARSIIHSLKCILFLICF